MSPDLAVSRHFLTRWPIEVRVCMRACVSVCMCALRADCLAPWPSHFGDLFVCTCCVAERFMCGCEVFVCVRLRSCGDSSCCRRPRDQSEINRGGNNRGNKVQIRPHCTEFDFISFSFMIFHSDSIHLYTNMCTFYPSRWKKICWLLLF